MKFGLLIATLAGLAASQAFQSQGLPFQFPSNRNGVSSTQKSNPNFSATAQGETFKQTRNFANSQLGFQAPSAPTQTRFDYNSMGNQNLNRQFQRPGQFQLQMTRPQQINANSNQRQTFMPPAFVKQNQSSGLGYNGNSDFRKPEGNRRDTYGDSDDLNGRDWRNNAPKGTNNHYQNSKGYTQRNQEFSSRRNREEQDDEPLEITLRIGNKFYRAIPLRGNSSESFMRRTSNKSYTSGQGSKSLESRSQQFQNKASRQNRDYYGPQFQGKLQQGLQIAGQDNSVASGNDRPFRGNNSLQQGPSVGGDASVPNRTFQNRQFQQNGQVRSSDNTTRNGDKFKNNQTVGSNQPQKGHRLQNQAQSQQGPQIPLQSQFKPQQTLTQSVSNVQSNRSNDQRRSSLPLIPQQGPLFLNQSP